MSATEDAITQLLEPTLSPLGLLIEEVTVIPAGKRRLVRVLVDRTLDLSDPVEETIDPVTLDEVTDATRAINEQLDASDVMGEQPYVLEVSSPGTDRPLTLPRHFARNVGRLVTVTLADTSKVNGRIVRADASSVTVMPEQGGKKAGAAPGAEPVQLNENDITSAKVQVEFARSKDELAGEDV